MMPDRPVQSFDLTRVRPCAAIHCRTERGRRFRKRRACSEARGTHFGV